MLSLLRVSEIRTVLLVHFCWHLSVSMLLIVPKWLHGLEFSEGRIGLVMGVGGVAILVFTPVVGRFIDRYRRIHLLRVATAACLPLILLMGPAVEVGGVWIEVLRVAQGIAFGFAFPVAGALIADYAPAGDRVRALGLFGIVTQSTQAAGPALAEAITAVADYEAVFFSSAMISLLAALLTFLVGSRPPEAASSTDGEPEARHLTVPGLTAALLTIVIVTGVTYGVIVTFVPVMLLQLGVASVGPFFAAVSLSSVAVRAFFGGLGDRMDQDRLILYSALGVTAAVVFAAAVGSLAPAAAQAALLGLVIGVMFGCSAGLFYPVANVRFIELGPLEVRGKRMAYYASAYSTGITAGNLFLGFTAQYLGFAIMYAAVAGVHLLSGAYYLIASRPARLQRALMERG